MANHNPKPQKSREDNALKFILWAFGISGFLIFLCSFLHYLKIIELDSRLIIVGLGTIIVTINRILYLVFKSIFAKNTKN